MSGVTAAPETRAYVGDVWRPGMRAQMTRLLAGGALATAVVGGAEAQSFGIGGAWTAWDHTLLGSQHGVAIALGVPFAAGRFRVRLTGERGSGRHGRAGIACGGFIDVPSECPFERLEDDGTSISAALGLEARVARIGPLSLWAGGAMRYARVEAVTRGLTTERTISGSGRYYGGEMTLGAAWRISRRLPLVLEGGSALGWLESREGIALDAYIPFAKGMGVDRIWVGLSWVL
ncbi:MAG: hypothetical protein R2909_01230 [Gemmatimonadales bacterium]